MSAYRFPEFTRRLLLLSHSEETVQDLEAVITDEKREAWSEGWHARGFDVPGAGKVTANPYAAEVAS